jgi:putative hemolysin
MKTTRVTLLIGLLLALLAGCAPQATPQPEQPGAASLTGAANPASVNCEKQGGTLQIEKRGDGGEFGVCFFEDALQCEEWALLRGECPVGGIKVTGYITPAARYCAITGGEYTITGGSGDTEQGTCAFKNAKTCDVWEYYSGKCMP